MPFADLREYLDALAAADELLRLEQPIDPDLELGAVWTLLTRQRGPAGLHERGTVEGYPNWRVASNLFGTFDRIAIALETDEATLFDDAAERIEERVPPQTVDDGPVSENDYRNDAVDLTEQVPNVRWNAGDGGPFVTAGHTVLRDPEHGTNVAWYRVQLLGPKRIAVRLAPHHQGGAFVERAKERGETELDVAVYLGGPPTAVLGTAAGVPIAASEYEVMGGLRGEPLDLVECETVDLRVPATAECVIEGRVQFDETVEEGPFGEFCGTYSGSYEEHPVDVTRVAHRTDPVFVGTAESKPVNETHVLQSLFKSVNARSALGPLVPEIDDVYYPPESGGFFEAIVRMDGALKRPGIAKNVLYQTLAGDATAKLLILVDDDIDIRDRTEVQWALTTRVQPTEDIVTVPDGMTTSLDPSADEDGVTDKVFVDATVDASFRGEFITLDDGALARAEEILAAAHDDG